jgi:hypothetical protein
MRGTVRRWNALSARCVVVSSSSLGPTADQIPELRSREHLTADAVEKFIEAAKSNRYGHRDALMVLLAYRRGLRARAAEVAGGGAG